jgi:hypothetical protein
MDAQASDADAIGIDPVHARWTIVDGNQPAPSARAIWKVAKAAT